MKTVLLLIMILTTTLSHAGDFGGNGRRGGDAYVDEFKAYRSWLLRILKNEHTQYEKVFGWTPEKYAAALERMAQVHLIRKGRPDVMVPLRGKDVLVTSLLPISLDVLFRIEGEPKMAVSLTIEEGLDVTFFDETEWDKLSGKTLRKLKLVGHELFTFFELENTGDNRYTQHFDDNLIRRHPFSTDGEIPLVPLWSIPFSTEIQIEDSEHCLSSRPQAVLKGMIGEACRPQLPIELPSPYFAFDCLFDGDMVTPVRKSYQVTHYVTTADIPGSYSYGRSKGKVSYYNNAGGSITTFTKSWNRHWHHYQPGYTYYHDTIVSTPVWQKFCRIDGTLTLIGFDPKTDDTGLKLLKRSKDLGDWNDTLISQSNQAEQLCRNQCFEYRKQLPKGLVNSSRCQIIENKNKTFGWELWGIFPYRSQPQFNQ